MAEKSEFTTGKYAFILLNIWQAVNIIGEHIHNELWKQDDSISFFRFWRCYDVFFMQV